MACQKEETAFSNNPAEISYQKTTGINLNSDSLHIVFGFGGSLGTDNDLLDWADTVSNGYFFINILDSIDVALEIAEDRNEFDTLDLTDDVTEGFKDILEGMVHGGSKGATQLFEHTNYQGSSKWVWWPTPYLGRSWNNKASSLKYATIGGVLCNYRWWGGRKVWYFTLSNAGIKDLNVVNFNDKTTSVWIY